MKGLIGFLALVTLGLAGAIRLAPSDPGRWNAAIDPSSMEGPSNLVRASTGSARVWVSKDRGDPRALLARLDAIARETPRTTLLAGSVESGRMTWITRSAFWGFPDYTTAESVETGLFVFARLRFGFSDLGVNAARLSDWIDRL
jgi:hypothetical protein